MHHWLVVLAQPVEVVNTFIEQFDKIEAEAT